MNIIVTSLNTIKGQAYCKGTAYCKSLKKDQPTAAVRASVQKLLEQLIGSDQQEPLGADESL